MRARIHRGAREIGGSCAEIECDGARIVLDLGRPLASPLEEALPLPEIAGLRGGDRSLVGVLISHGHPDHWGLAPQLPPDVPLYMGAGTQRVLRAATFFSPAGAELETAGHLEDRVPLQLGPFRVTPVLIDHSAFDAYSLLIEAAGRRLFYSGDLRGHGRRAALVDRLVSDPPRDVHALLLVALSCGHPRAP